MVGEKVDLDYHVKLLPQSDQAEVRLSLSQGSAVRSLNFDLGRDGDYSDFKADGQWQVTPDAGPVAACGSRVPTRPA